MRDLEPSDDRSAGRRYASAVVLTALATLLRLRLDPWLGDTVPFTLTFAAIATAAWYGGLGPGLLAMTLNAVVVVYFFLAPRLSFAATGQQLAGVFTYLITGLIVVLLAEQNRRRQLRAEAEARAAARRREWLRVILSSLGDAVIAADTSGRVTLLNPVAESLTGWPEAEAIGKPVDEVLSLRHETTRLPAENPLWRVLTEGRAVSLAEHTILTSRDGVERPIDDSTAPIREHGAVVGAVLVCRDVSAARRAALALADSEERLRRALALAEEASRAKDRFLAMLSHELRTPLSPVLLTLDEMLIDPDATLDRRESIMRIRRGVELEVRLIDDLLDVSRVVHGKLQYRFETTDLHALIDRVLDICREDLVAKRIDLSLTLAATAHHVRADPARLQQVLWNLVKNAVKFTPAGGAAQIRTYHDLDSSRLVVEVSDTGIGIDPAVLPRVFNAFEQAEEAADGRYGGLGLGMAISRAIVVAHGGSLTAASPGRNQGATFRLILPTVAPVADADHAPDADDAETPSRPLRILLVEDDPTTARIMARLLRNNGHDVTTANTLAAALAVSVETIDLVVSDLGLPDGHGLDLMRSIAARGGVPGIALTGFGMEDDIRRSRAAGFVAHLTKPVDFARLNAIILSVAAEHLHPAPHGGPMTIDHD